MPTRGHEGHDAGKPEGVPAHPAPKSGPENPGYETQDVNVKGVIYFLGGLVGFLFVFFFLCFFVGKLLNYGFVKEDGAPDRWHPYGTTHNAERQNLQPNYVQEQKESAALVASLPAPRPPVDDDNQETADLHAREDLLLDHYSTDGATTRIPIDKAMQLIAQRGLGTPVPAAQPGKLMMGENTPSVQAPLTNGFARTGYELDTMATREQKLTFEHASEKSHKE